MTLGLRPSPEEWAAFRRALDDIEMWQWNDSYVDLGVMDGTNWSFTARYARRGVEPRGSRRPPATELGVSGAHGVLLEFDEILMRLNTKERAETFSQIDRERAEAEFRWAVALPLAALSLVVAERVGFARYLVGSMMISLVGVTFALLLWHQGNARELRARRSLVTALRLNLVVAPTIERIERALRVLYVPSERERVEIRKTMDEATALDRGSSDSSGL